MSIILRAFWRKWDQSTKHITFRYVVHDDYRPTWEVPVLAKFYSDLGYSFQETLNSHIRSVLGPEEPVKMWNTIYDIIRDVYTNKEKDFIKGGYYRLL